MLPVYRKYNFNALTLLNRCLAHETQRFFPGQVENQEGQLIVFHQKISFEMKLVLADNIRQL